jgi:hypothetical protein
MFQYHPRSDHHSKTCCWVIAFDLLATSSLLRSHVADGKVCIGVNHKMVDFKSGTPKNLDLVIARPAADVRVSRRPQTLADFGKRWGIRLTEDEQAEFSALPTVEKRPVGHVLVALEAKTAATAHQKAESRMFDELNSSHAIVHGAADQAVAVGLAVVNIADSFVSPDRQRPGEAVVVNRHSQPRASDSLIRKLRDLPRRSGPGGPGFDALGIMVVVLHNDGSRVTIHTALPAPQPGDPDTYAAMILRAASLYDYRFSTL